MDLSARPRGVASIRAAEAVDPLKACLVVVSST